MMKNPMDDGAVDLSPLDLGADPARMEHLVSSIMHSATPELRRRARFAAAPDPFATLQSWSRPVLAAAAMVSALALGLLGWQQTTDGSLDFVTVAEALDIGGPTADWLAEGREPTTADFIALLEGF